MKPVFKILPHETLADALRRVLGREPTLHDMAECWGAPGDSGHSAVKPGSDHLGRVGFAENPQ